jgi:hypothetical protein
MIFLLGVATGIVFILLASTVLWLSMSADLDCAIELQSGLNQPGSESPILKTSDGHLLFFQRAPEPQDAYAVFPNA